jgi:trk system potassium uptake protein
MHVIVAGCGRVGTSVALDLDAAGHDVVIIDRHAEAFRRLGTSFRGRTLTGVAFDRAVLQSAGISELSAVAAVTSGDNSNILIARVARETFGARHVVARIYDPKRAQVYQRLGIPTVASVAWTSGRVLRAILPHDDGHDWDDPTSTHVLVERRVPAALAGASIASVTDATRSVSLLTRQGMAQIPAPALLLQEDDVIHVMVRTDELERLDGVLGTSPEVDR